MWFLIWAACGPAAIAPGATTTPTSPGTTLPAWDPFPSDRVVEVSITVDPEDWDVLRHQGISVVEELADESCLDEPFPDPYDWFPAEVVIDGIALDDVALRKKGFVGSLSTTRPSLKLHFSKYVEGRRLGGLERMTLNNDRQDPSHVRQCLGYGFFAEAGIPAARCALAHVVVNGDDLGVYTHVESMKEPFLERAFGTPDAPFWEGTVSDFREGWTGTFEPKTDAADPADIEAVALAAEAPDGELLDALGEVIDLDAFVRFWAAEVLVTHWDGYAGNTNNFYVYRPPESGRFLFVPWGIDAAFQPGSPFGDGLPTSVVANGVLAHRLYALPEGREAYLGAMASLLADAWDEDRLLAEIDRLEALALGALPEGDDPAALSAEVDVVRDVVAGRREAVQAELDAGGADWPLELRDTPCLVPHGTVEADFTTAFGTLDAWNPLVEGEVELALTWDGEAVVFEQVGAVAGEDGEGNAVIALLGLIADGTYGMVYLGVPLDALGPGAFPLDWNEAFGALYAYDPAVDASFAFVAYLADGELRLDEARAVPDATLAGTVEAGIWGF